MNLHDEEAAISLLGEGARRRVEAALADALQRVADALLAERRVRNAVTIHRALREMTGPMADIGVNESDYNRACGAVQNLGAAIDHAAVCCDKLATTFFSVTHISTDKDGAA